MFATIETSSIIISFSSDSDNLICVLFWSDIVGRTLLVFLGIAKLCLQLYHQCLVLLLLQVGAAGKTVGFSGLIGAYLKVLTTV